MTQVPFSRDVFKACPYWTSTIWNYFIFGKCFLLCTLNANALSKLIFTPFLKSQPLSPSFLVKKLGLRD